MLSAFQFFVWYYLASIYGKLVSFLCHLRIPRLLRPWVIRWYAWKTAAKTYEMKKSFSEYPSISSFFIREIKKRPIDPFSPIVAPVDCTILSAGRLDTRGYKIEQVKGIDYKMHEILGLDTQEAEALKDSDKYLYYMSIHLPVSECHIFHSPVDWIVKRRTHVPGTMFDLATWDLFNQRGVLYNERVVLEGEWEHGKFFFVPIAASVVGDIKLKFDPQLNTNVIGESFRAEEKGERFKNLKMDWWNVRARRMDYVKERGKGIYLRKGEEFGHFEGGSAFVAVFQHPDPDFRFTVDPPQFTLYGNPLAVVSTRTSSE